MTPPICFHLLPGVYDDAWVDWASRAAPWVKVCSASAIARSAANGAKVYYRPCFLPTDDGEGDCADGTLWAQKVIAAIETAGGHWPDAIGFRNELHATVASAEQYVAYRAALRAAGYKGIVALGSFSVGTPDWPDYAAMLAVQPDALEVHEYWDLTVAGSPDLALRHVEAIRRGMLPTTMPLFVGECGSDRLGVEDAQKRRGWNDQGKLTAAQEVANIAAYQAACAPSVVACFVFADGMPANGWDDFAIRGTVIEPTIRKSWSAKAMGIASTGVDESSLQPPIDWPTFARQHGFVCIKATEGTGYVNPRFEADWRAAGASGLPRIAYHFGRPDLGNDPAAEADYLMAVAGPLLAPGDNIALDFEVGRGDLRAWAESWVRRAWLRVGWETIFFYSYPSFLVEHNLLNSAILDRCALWYASYQANWPPVPAGWSSIAIWQDSSTASEAGVPGLVDQDVSRLTVAQIRALGKPDPQQPQGGIVDITQEAVARFSALGVSPNQQGALFKAYERMVQAWLGGNRDGVLDPTPAIKPEAVTPDGADAYLLLDSGRILHWQKSDGLVYQAEDRERAAIYKTCGWAA